MKERGGCLKCAVYESTLSTADAVPLPQWGRLRYEDAAIPASLKRIHAYVEKQYPRQSLPRVGKVASKASRIEFYRHEKERGDHLRSTIHESTLCKKQLIKPIYSYKKRKSNAANDFNVICRSGYRYMQEKSEAVHFYD